MKPDYWYLVAEYVATKLVNAGAWDKAVYLFKETPVEDDEDAHYPNVCVYVDSESTREKQSDMVFSQELRLKIEIRERYDSSKDHTAGFVGQGLLPPHPALNNAAMKRLAIATGMVKDAVVAALTGTHTHDGETLRFDELSGITCEVNRSVSGAVQHCMATIDLTVTIPLCYEREPIETCPLTGIFGEINYTQCRDSAAVPAGATLDGSTDTGVC